jgi:valyl-tRNA synthetase
VVVATTRPETMLGDTGVAVNLTICAYAERASRSRRSWSAASPSLPTPQWIAIPGTGAVELHSRARSGRLLSWPAAPARGAGCDDRRRADEPECPERFRGLERFEARQRVVAELEQLGLLEKTEPQRYAVGRCYRCDTIVEPRLSDQWFVRCARSPSRARCVSGRPMRFIPEHRGVEFAQWMEKFRDWCISASSGGATGSRCGTATSRIAKPPSRAGPTWCAVPTAGPGAPGRGCARHLVLLAAGAVLQPRLAGQDRGSGALYPGNTLVTAPEILFFCVAWMLMADLDSWATPSARCISTARCATPSIKMSKSLGNGI